MKYLSEVFSTYLDLFLLGDDVKVMNSVFADETVMKVMYRKPKDLETLRFSSGLLLINVFDLRISGILLKDGKAESSLTTMLKGYKKSFVIF